MDNYGTVTKEVVLRTTVRTRLRLNSATKRYLWSLRQQQREFYNKGVEIGLFAHGNGEYIPSNYTSYTSVLSAVRKDKDAPLGPAEPHPTAKRFERGVGVGTQVV